jgi:hypothetical protein
MTVMARPEPRHLSVKHNDPPAAALPSVAPCSDSSTFLHFRPQDLCVGLPISSDQNDRFPKDAFSKSQKKSCAKTQLFLRSISKNEILLHNNRASRRIQCAVNAHTLAVEFLHLILRVHVIGFAGIVPQYIFSALIYHCACKGLGFRCGA